MEQSPITSSNNTDLGIEATSEFINVLLETGFIRFRFSDIIG